MPIHRSRNQNGKLYHHQRNTSGGSSKVGINNLQLTSKDPKPSNLKRTVNSAVDLHHGRNAHLSSNSRVQSKERIAALQQKRSHTPAAKGKQPQAQKVNGFTISHSEDDSDDDDEWVSSESGAATPQNLEKTGEEDEINGQVSVTTGKNETAPHVGVTNGFADRLANGVDELTTPRAEVQLELTRVETARPETSTSRVQTQTSPPVVRVQPQTTPSSPDPPSPARSPEQMPVRQVRSEAPSPSQLRHNIMPKRHSLIRHSSNYGDSKVELPPHPLIRGQSQHSALKPAALAPLMVNSQVAQAQLLASPSSRSASPTYQSFYQSPSEASTISKDRYPSRKSSFSSLHSIATLPAPSRFHHGKEKGDRSRTLSSISTSSSSAALNALNMIPAISRPGTPPLVVRFPPESRRNAHDAYHQLLPPPYLASYMSMSTKHNPLLNSYERIMQAKNSKPRQ